MPRFVSRKIDIDGYIHVLKSNYPTIYDGLLEYIGNVFEAEDNVAVINLVQGNSTHVEVIGGTEPLNKDKLEILGYSNKRGNNMTGQMGVGRWIPLVHGKTKEMIYEQSGKKFILNKDLCLSSVQNSSYKNKKVKASFYWSDNINEKELKRAIQRRFGLAIMRYNKKIILNGRTVNPIVPHCKFVEINNIHKKYNLIFWLNPLEQDETWNKRAPFKNKSGIIATLKGEMVCIDPLGSTNHDPVFGFIDDPTGKEFSPHLELGKRHFGDQQFVYYLARISRVAIKPCIVKDTISDSTKLFDDIKNMFKKGGGYEANKPPKYTWKRLNKGKVVDIIGIRDYDILEVYNKNKPFIYIDTLKNIIAINVKKQNGNLCYPNIVEAFIKSKDILQVMIMRVLDMWRHKKEYFSNPIIEQSWFRQDKLFDIRLRKEKKKRNIIMQDVL